MKMVQDIIIKPIITEASMDRLADKKYTFKVAKSATKPEIAKAVEEMFGVKVATVNTINMKKKPKRLDGLGISSQSNDCFLPLGSVSEVNAESLGLLLHIDRVYNSDLNAEQLLNCFCNLGLSCVCCYLEGVFLLSELIHACLCDNRLNDDILYHFHYAYTSSSFSTAARVMITFSALSTS